MGYRIFMSCVVVVVAAASAKTAPYLLRSRSSAAAVAIASIHLFCGVNMSKGYTATLQYR